MKYLSVTFTLFGLMLAASGAYAQDNAQDKSKMDKGSMTVTGCLAQGATDNEYTIRDENGKTYEVTGTKVNVKPHVGHKVSITGVSENKGNREALDVTNLKMVSTTCP